MRDYLCAGGWREQLPDCTTLCTHSLPAPCCSSAHACAACFVTVAAAAITPFTVEKRGWTPEFQPETRSHSQMGNTSSTAATRGHKQTQRTRSRQASANVCSQAPARQTLAFAFLHACSQPTALYEALLPPQLPSRLHAFMRAKCLHAAHSSSTHACMPTLSERAIRKTAACVCCAECRG